MTGPELFALVSEKKQRIEDLLDPTTFVLNPEIEQLEAEIGELQRQCEHHYDNGVCVYCGQAEN